jgi:hypothetical protein
MISKKRVSRRYRALSTDASHEGNDSVWKGKACASTTLMRGTDLPTGTEAGRFVRIS